MNEVESTKNESSVIRVILPWSRRKEIYSKFKKHQGILYYKVYPIKESVKIDEIKKFTHPFINEKQLEVKGESLDMDEGERTYSIVFGNPAALV